MPKFTEKMFYHMKAVDEFNGDAPDGAWWAMLQETAAKYVEFDDAHDAVHAYLVWSREQKKDHAG